VTENASGRDLGFHQYPREHANALPQDITILFLGSLPTNADKPILGCSMNCLAMMTIPIVIGASSLAAAIQIAVIARIVPSSVRHRPSFAHSSRRLGSP